MALQITGILDAVVSHAMASGLFEQVNEHEPMNPPGHGLTAAVWVDRIDPVLTSGLSSTSARIVLNLRLYTSALTEPLDAIDPNLTAAVDTLMAAYAGDFTLGGLIRLVDLRGAEGDRLLAQAGYIRQADADYRVFTITLPVIVNDLWEEAP